MSTLTVAIRRLGLLVLILSVATLVYTTRRWPVTGDAALMHYVAATAQNGNVIYRDLEDINFPLAHAPDWLVLRTFGTATLPWRLYDFGLLAAIGVAMFLISRQRCRSAGIWAACLFALIHARDGIEQAGQRDLFATALVSLGVACLITCLRRRYLSAIVFGLLIGIATLVKPTFAAFVLLAFAAFPPRAGGRSWRDSSAVVLAFSTPLALCVLWLHHQGALRAFLFCATVLAHFHATLGHPTLVSLLYTSISPTLPLVALWLLIIVIQLCSIPVRDSSLRSSEKTYNRAKTILRLATMIGLLSYLLQQKGFPYQRYPFLAFLILLIGTDMQDALTRSPLQRLVAGTALLWASLIFAPSSAWKASHYDWQHRQFVQTLTSDLEVLSRGNVASLSGHVLCIDSVSGCLEALYKLHLQSSSRVMYDEFLFHGGDDAAVQNSRRSFAEDIAKAPEVIVLGAHLFPSGPDQYDKLKQWPEFNLWLQQHYWLQAERAPAKMVQSVGRPFFPPGYRLYVLRK